MEWSNGVMRLMATFRCEGICNAELCTDIRSENRRGTEMNAPYDAICSFSDDIQNIVVATDDEIR